MTLVPISSRFGGLSRWKVATCLVQLCAASMLVCLGGIIRGSSLSVLFYMLKLRTIPFKSGGGEGREIGLDPSPSLSD